MTEPSSRTPSGAATSRHSTDGGEGQQLGLLLPAELLERCRQRRRVGARHAVAAQHDDAVGVGRDRRAGRRRVGHKRQHRLVARDAPSLADEGLELEPGVGDDGERTIHRGSTLSPAGLMPRSPAPVR